MLKKIEEARALYDQAKGKPVRVKAMKDEKTAFKLFSGSALIVNGVAQNNDLILETPGMRATGMGSADLPQEKLDYRLNVTQTKDAGKKCASLPLLISGPFASLGYSLDFEAIVKCKGSAAVEKKKEELGNKLNEKLKEKGLEGLFKKRK